MNTVYTALVRWGPEWDSQSIYYTKSSALFEQMKQVTSRVIGIYYQDFNEELKAELERSTSEYVSEDMSISDAMEVLECSYDEYNTFPVIVAGNTEIECYWNWA